MIKNYIKIAWRSLWKNKVSSVINIISLAIGLSASMVIGMMVYYDFTFDQFHPDGDRTYRITSKFQDPEDISYFPAVPLPLVEEIKQNYTGVETVAFLKTARPFNVIINKENAPVLEPEHVVYADKDYFDIFEYQWLAGSGLKPLSEPNEVILTASRARAYFPNKKPDQILGRTLIYNDSINVTVSGVVADFEERSDLVFQEFISLNTQPVSKNQMEANWTNISSSNQLLVKLKEDTSATNFQKQLDQTSLDHEDAEDKRNGETREFYAQPFLDMHFDQNYTGFDRTSTTADKTILTMLGVIAAFLLLLGCVNFININTAQASQRSKEIGIRKTLGSSKSQLINQFLSETFILTLAAAILSLVLSVWLIHVFDDFIADGVNFSLLADPYLILSIVTLIILVTLIAGFYPGFVLARFKPTKVLKGNHNQDGGKNGLRKFLTIFQFTVAYVFVIATLLVGKQIQFMMDQDLGFKSESIVYIDTPGNIDGVESRQLLAQKLQTIPQVSKVSLGGGTPVSVNYKTVFTHQGKDGEREIDIDIVFGDSKFLDLYEIPLVAGRLPLNDTIKEVVINRTAVKKLGFNSPEEALNETVNPDQNPMLITGVMEDFQNGSLKNEISAMGLTGDIYRKFWLQFNTVHASINTSSGETMAAAITNIEERFDEVYPDSNMKINFMDETVANFYVKERSMLKLLNWAMGLSVLISCLGLLGLVVFTTERRIKEIGIRKVLGATVTQINLLLCKDFVWLVGISFLIAAPIAYWSVNDWLQDFVTRTELSWWVFAGSGLGMLALAVTIMSFKTIKAAMENPVDNLKVE
ncbi:MAG: FtsX-like permease family protein [Nonlabens sp.]